MPGNLVAIYGFALSLSGAALAAVPTPLLEEKFEDTNFAARAWYDGTGPPLSSVEHIPGSTKSAQYHWRVGGTTPVNTGPFRRKFTPSDAIFVSYWVKYSTNYTGSNKPYHPHEFTILTTKNGDYAGPAYTHLTGYIEHNEGKPVLALQDGQNINETRIGQDLSAITENRSVAGCNGNNPDGYASVDCYQSGSVHWNGKIWKSDQVYFRDVPGPFYKNDWHRVEAYFKMNTISAGKGQPDGQLRYWFDGALLIERTNVLMRTAINADMKWNQFLIAPYIGDGSPVEQTMWVDDLRISSSRFIADTDNDKMPDDWETANQLDPIDPTDALQDTDGDRFNNLSEFQAGTNPRDSNSALSISDVIISGNNCAIHFNTVIGKSYQLERANVLPSAAWFAVSTNVPGNGGLVEISDMNGALTSARYYRLKL